MALGSHCSNSVAVFSTWVTSESRMALAAVSVKNCFLYPSEVWIVVRLEREPFIIVSCKFAFTQSIARFRTYRQAQYVFYWWIKSLPIFLVLYFFFHILMCFEKLLLLLRCVNDEDTAR